MPSQIVLLPASILQTILSLSEFQLGIAFGPRNMQAKASLLDGTPSLRIDVDRPVVCPEISNRLNDDVYAVLVTSSLEAPGLAGPTPLPDGLVQHILDDVGDAMTSLPRLTGHDKMGIAAAISDARGTTRPCLPRPSHSKPDTAVPEETKVQRIQRAAKLQKVLQPGLDRIDGELARYGVHVRQNGVELGVARLGLQADLGAALKLEFSGEFFEARLRRRHRRGSFLELWHSTQNTLAGFEDCLGRIHRVSAEGRNWLDAALLPLHSTLLRVIAPPYDSGRYRSPEMRIGSPFSGALVELALPADQVPAAVGAFAAGYDRRLWTDIHPLVRAGMAHVELMAIHPFGDGNGRLGRLLILAMLIEDFLPGLPLEVILAWNRDAYLERVDAAIRKADLLGFMQFLLKVVDKAISLGRSFVPGLAKHRDALFPKFLEVGGRFATTVAEHAASMVIGPDEQLAVRALMDPFSLGDYLGEAGLDPVKIGSFDLVGRQISTAWSSPVARDLLIAPPAKI